MATSERNNSKLYYYDFWIGTRDQPVKDWRYRAIKIAAPSPRMAVYIKQMMSLDITRRKVNKFVMDSGAMYSAQFYIRKVVEYEFIRRSGRTQYVFKKHAEYRIDDI